MSPDPLITRRSLGSKTKSRNESLQLRVLVNPVGGNSFNVENLSSQWKNGLSSSISPLLSRQDSRREESLPSNHVSSSLSSYGIEIQDFVNSAARMASTTGRTSGFPRRPLVRPSNSGSVMDTEIIAVKPSHMNPPGKLGAPSLSFRSRLAT